MKKIFITSLLALAGLFATSCVQEHIDVIYDPANVTVQTLGEFAGGALSEDGSPITAQYNAANFNVTVPVSYTLFVNAEGADFENAKKVDATIGDGKISIEQPKLNKLLGNLGATPNEEFAVEFRLDAFIMNEKGAVESTRKSSNLVRAVYTPYETEKVLDVCDVPGDYQGWAPSDYPKLFNYSGDGTIYRGVIDFQCKNESGSAANGFKITYGGNWDNDSGNWGSASQGEAAEAASVQLINGDGSQNIICYGEKRYYLFSFNKDQLVLTKLMSFDKVGVIGLNGDWDNDIEMTYNMYKGRFWADVDAASATEFKFRLDGAWDNNWGGSLDNLAGGGDNIAIEAGQYRIYFYMNDEVLTATVDATMYGQEEPTIDEPEPEPVTYEGWGIIGDFNEWATDVEMTEKDGVWTGYFNVAADQGWKLRKDAGWDENVGGTFTAFGTPFEAVAGGDNIVIGQDGFFKVVYDTNAGTITVSEGNVWSIIGDFNEWAGDIDMEEVDGKWIARDIALSGGWKLRYNHGWDENRGGTFEALGTPFAVTNGGDNINCGEGKFVITYDPAAETLLVENSMPSDTWSLIGVNGDWENDIWMTEIRPGVWASPKTAINGEFKIRFNHDWAVNRGGEDLTVGTVSEAVPDGRNINVADGSYIVIYDANEEIIYLQGWSLIGTIDGTSWDADIPMIPTQTSEGSSDIVWMSYVFKTDAACEFKARFDANWDVNRGGTFTDFCEPFDVTNNGDNIALPDAGYYFAIYYPALEKMGVGRADWGVIGGFNDWNGDVVMLESESKGIYTAFVSFAEDTEFKIRQNRAWNNDRGGTLGALGTAFTAEAGGANIQCAAGNYLITYDSNAETITVTADE
ncbi:MAG: SusE domain-containing protein [Bacteroidales bacterium]|nr:SusE domain-containing protein [Bacteroidales bacterium]